MGLGAWLVCPFATPASLVRCALSAKHASALGRSPARFASQALALALCGALALFGSFELGEPFALLGSPMQIVLLAWGGFSVQLTWPELRAAPVRFASLAWFPLLPQLATFPAFVILLAPATPSASATLAALTALPTLPMLPVLAALPMLPAFAALPMLPAFAALPMLSEFVALPAFVTFAAFPMLSAFVVPSMLFAFAMLSSSHFLVQLPSRDAESIAMRISVPATTSSAM